MRIGIQGWGSEGDVRPLLALAAELRGRGHEVRLVLSPIDGVDYVAIGRTYGLDVRVVPEGTALSLQAIVEAAQSKDPSKLSRAVLEQGFYPQLDAMYAAAIDLCAQSDVVVGLFSSWYVKAACQKTGTPFACVHYYPGFVASRDTPPAGFPAWRWLNPISWSLVGALMNMAFLGPAAKFFARHGLPAPRAALTDLLMSDRLNLHATSPTLFPPPPDRSGAHPICGDFVFPESAEAWTPPPALQAFLDAGDPPVLVSFGTHELLAPERAYALVAAASRLAGVRVLYQTKCATAAKAGDEQVHVLRWAPHRILAPACSAMVLHGGAGTTHAALRAGLPAVVLPFIVEQRLWGGLLHRAGGAVRPLSFWKATPKKLAERLREAVTGEAVKRRARELAEAVREEKGVARASEAVERMGR
ncbi:MAG TPA: glycosyltransferase [Polyangiaceae bacterium]|jgi:UDP:flavonoid glycosyltransferase YjiC (YdhE family)